MKLEQGIATGNERQTDANYEMAREEKLSREKSHKVLKRSERKD